MLLAEFQGQDWGKLILWHSTGGSGCVSHDLDTKTLGWDAGGTWTLSGVVGYIFRMNLLMRSTEWRTSGWGLMSEGLGFLLCGCHYFYAWLSLEMTFSISHLRTFPWVLLALSGPCLLQVHRRLFSWKTTFAPTKHCWERVWDFDSGHTPSSFSAAPSHGLSPALEEKTASSLYTCHMPGSCYFNPNEPAPDNSVLGGTRLIYSRSGRTLEGPLIPIPHTGLYTVKIYLLNCHDWPISITVYSLAMLAQWRVPGLFQERTFRDVTQVVPLLPSAPPPSV
jgi:hypothetical protein